jgi:manganese transport protein
LALPILHLTGFMESIHPHQDAGGAGGRDPADRRILTVEIAGAVPAAANPAAAAPARASLWNGRIARPISLTDRTVRMAQEVLAGRRHGITAHLAFVGPAVVASIAYMDPGNFATNIQAGAKYGYALLWVVVFANLLAMLFQALSAKLGIVTGRNLAELCREQFRKPVVWAMWVVSEIAAMATDLAEFLGGAIGLTLLFRMPLLGGMAGTAVVTYAILMFDRKGFRPLELIIGTLVGVIGLCYFVEMLIAPIDWGAAAYHTLVPQIADREALLLAVGIIGATVMPHAIFLHSGLTQGRTPVATDAARRQVLRFSNQEVVIALAVAGIVNMAMVMMASSAFHAGHSDVAEIETAYYTLTPLLGGAAASVFLLSLIASGISSSAVGTMAGQMIMQGFIGFRIPVAVRRLVTMLPAFAVVGFGANATKALVISQVVLSIALPLPMIALLIFTRRPDLMGAFANGRITQGAAIAGTAVVLALNLFLVLQTLGVSFPGL